jgi:biopolymer transport protein ExbB
MNRGKHNRGQSMLARSSMFTRLVCAFFVAAFAMPHSAFAWWNDEWSYRKKIGINAQGAATEDVSRLPLLVRLHDGNFKFSDAKDDGSDLRFVAGDDKTPLKFHIDTYDGLLGIALVWVDVPVVKVSGSNDIWLYYGNAKAPAGADPKGAYDNDTTLVYHFGEANAPARDQTAYANDATAPVRSVDNSIIGRGVRFDGSNPLALPASPSLAIAQGSPFTWSAWVKQDAAQPQSVLFAKRDGANGLVVGIDQGIPYASIISGNNAARAAATAPIAPATWHHIAITASDRLTIYVDGKMAGEAAGTLPALNAAGSVGGDSGTAPNGFVGELDELEMSRTARSASFVGVLSGSESENGQVVVYGQDEENAGWSGGYFGVILRSVTIDGWVVIGILMVMAAISWVVMATKSRDIARVAGANAKFLKVFTKVGGDPTRLEAEFGGRKPSSLRQSGLYLICEAGREELERRFGVNPKATPVLTPQAIASIRANLDRIAAYEGQRLNSMMVLLTIAISGGPFLGLLGTVVGVMITFAAIAATGDVNVNAIAPGIAAALVATVAGLAVAIPALFGYNYLITRIKDLTTEMHVFIDEFVTRLAEAYSPNSPTPEAPRLAAE